VEQTFRIPCAWRSTLSDTIDREIYHRKNETIAGNYHSLRPSLNSELKLTNKVKKGEFLSKCGQCLIFFFSPTEWLSVGWFFKPKIHGKSQNCREILEKTKRVKVILYFFSHFFPIFLHCLRDKKICQCVKILLFVAMWAGCPCKGFTCWYISRSMVSERVDRQAQGILKVCSSCTSTTLLLYNIKFIK